MEVTVIRIDTELVPTETQGRDANKQYAYMGVDASGNDVYRELSEAEVQQREAEGAAFVALSRERKVQETKAEARKRILAILPDWKQRNYAARAVEIIADEEVGSDEWNEIQAAWRQIEAVRTASDVIEAQIADLTDAEAGAFDVAASSEWP